MSYSKISSKHQEYLLSIVGEDNLLLNKDKLQEYGKDRTENLVFPPELILIPSTVEQISQILSYSNQEVIPVTVRGAGTGLAGGALPVCGGIVLSMERFNQILDIDERNLQVTTEPGVITEVLQNAVQAKGLFYPPDPASKGSSFIGGNIACNSGGPKAVKYGVVKDYVLNLEVVLANGDIIWTGANTLKNSTGYNLTQLLVGSEGTLGVITKAVLKLLPYPTHSLLMLIPFNSAVRACEAVSAIFRAGVIPSSLEFMERRAIELAMDYVEDASLVLTKETAAHLIVEVDGNHLEKLYQDCEQISQVVEAFDCGDILFADDEATKTKLWKLRRNLNPAVKQYSSDVKKADTVVPRAALPELLEGIHRISELHGINAVNYGHAGDGNLHVTLMREALTSQKWAAAWPLAMRQIFELVGQLKGTISGEHGIGWIQKSYLDIVFTEAELNIMRAIKTSFDPKHILNPQKIF